MLVTDDGSREEIKLQIVHFFLPQKAQKFSCLILLFVREYKLFNNHFLTSLTEIPNHLEENIFRNRHYQSLQDKHFKHVEQIFFYASFFQTRIEIDPHPFLLMTFDAKLNDPAYPKKHNLGI